MAEPVVYFVAGGGRIKIGHTIDLEQRLQTLGVVSPEKLELLVAVPAPRRAETALHSFLSEYRIGGEWFRDCEEVRAAMARFKRGSFNPVERLNVKRPVDENVAWASRALRTIAAPRRPDETTRDLIVRTAALVGLTYWRAFSLWYRKAHRLEISEREAITTVLEAAR